MKVYTYRIISSGRIIQYSELVTNMPSIQKAGQNKYNYIGHSD